MAASLADELIASLGVAPILEEGSGGVFIVTLDERTIYDKKNLGRFPDAGEVTQSILSQKSSSIPLP